MVPQHWLVAHRHAEIPRIAPEDQDPEDWTVPVAGPMNHSRLDYIAWKRESLNRVYGYASLADMCRRVAAGPRWYDIELESMIGRSLCPWRARNLVRSLPLKKRFSLGPALEDVEGEEGSDEGDTASGVRESSGTDTPLSGNGGNVTDMPSSPRESDTGDAPFTPQALELTPYSVEDHTVVLYQDLVSLFRYHIDASTPHIQVASALANREMEILMSRYEDSLAYLECNSNRSGRPAHLYSGMSERIKQSIVYYAYITWERSHFPTPPFAASQWRYLGPQRYFASRLRRQRISSMTLVVFQNKARMLKELKSMLWGRRHYLRWLERYPEAVVRAMWMLNPMFTRTHVGSLSP